MWIYVLHHEQVFPQDITNAYVEIMRNPTIPLKSDAQIKNPKDCRIELRQTESLAQSSISNLIDCAFPRKRGERKVNGIKAFNQKMGVERPSTLYTKEA